MDASHVLKQAAEVAAEAERAEQGGAFPDSDPQPAWPERAAATAVEPDPAEEGPVVLRLDLRDRSQRSAYAAAVAVLRTLGVDLGGVLSPGPPAAAIAVAAKPASTATVESPWEEPLDEQDLRLRAAYAQALLALCDGEEARRDTVLEGTYPQVRWLLRDGANVETVAEIQMRRWLEDHPTRR